MLYSHFGEFKCELNNHHRLQIARLNNVCIVDTIRVNIRTRDYDQGLRVRGIGIRRIRDSAEKTETVTFARNNCTYLLILFHLLGRYRSSVSFSELLSFGSSFFCLSSKSACMCTGI